MIAQMSRRFLIDVVHDLAAERGIRQFLDIGTGLPTADNTHEVAQRAAPGARIVYADYDRCKSGCVHGMEALSRPQYCALRDGDARKTCTNIILAIISD
jgi:hypothetical protein